MAPIMKVQCEGTVKERKVKEKEQGAQFTDQPNKASAEEG